MHALSAENWVESSRACVENVFPCGWCDVCQMLFLETQYTLAISIKKGKYHIPLENNEKKSQICPFWEPWLSSGNDRGFQALSFLPDMGFLVIETLIKSTTDNQFRSVLRYSCESGPLLMIRWFLFNF